MFCRCWLAFTILTVVLCAVLGLMARERGVCCKPTIFTFRIKPSARDRDCRTFRANDSKGKCIVYTCGSFIRPSPCCGLTPCNYFCCNCPNGCHNRNDFVKDDFINLFQGLIMDVKSKTVKL